MLLEGPTGSGKELFAHAIHHASPRQAKPFVAVNCSAFPKDLLESELFGYKKGAFTGALTDKKGLFEEAHGGTLFLDEIGELDISLQAKLLRVLESQEFNKLGDSKPTKVNVRLVATTNRNLRQEADQGHFRADLYYRLSVFVVPVPPLSAAATRSSRWPATSYSSTLPSSASACGVDLEKTAWVLLNLLANAVRYSPEAGRIVVGASYLPERRVVQVSVQDHGPGIALEHQERIFHRFAQVPDAEGSLRDGSGLGLSISREFITTQGGQLGGHSAPGTGSTFFFTLPLAT